MPPKKMAGLREETSSELVVHRDATLYPTAYESPTAIDVIQSDSTSAPTIGEEEPQIYVQSFAGLVDKYLFSKKTIPFTILLLICGVVSSVIFIQDNSAGLLINKKAVLWTLEKCLIFCVLILLIWVALSFVTWLKSRVSKYS
ncbi:MAG: hypothetical protein KBD53_06230 [Candidatus Omnitrophica bacterium]|nr:hypothetical protein [Candidatus Omnitrophota bacterium]